MAAPPARTAAIAAPALLAGGHGRPPAPWIRSAVREVLERAPNYRNLSADDRRTLAGAMVRVSALAAELIDEEGQAQQAIERQGGESAPAGVSQEARRPAPLARAQSQPGFAAAADRVAGTTQAVLNAVSFPRFVTDLINGVFRAMLDSSTQQMQQYVQLLNAVSASAEGFERTQFGLAQVRQWVADHFPESVEYETPDPDFDDPEDPVETRLRLRDGASMPDEEAIRATLGMEPGESVDASNPEQLVPLARRYLARQRQQMLATMVMMGMHRIVIDSGRINAAMRFHVDTRSAASEDRGSQFSLQNRVRAAGRFGAGPWGVSAEVENNIGYVSTQRNQSTEEMNTDLELNSSVELNFRSDYLPLNRMAAQAQADRIRNASINPVAESDPIAARTERLQAQHESERARREAMDTAIGEAGQTSMADSPLEVPEPNSGSQPAQAGGRTAAGGTTAGGTTAGGTTAGGTTAGGATAGGTTAGGTTAGGTTAGGTTAGGTTAGGTTAGGTTAGGTTAGGTTAGGTTAGGTTAGGTTAGGR